MGSDNEVIKQAEKACRPSILHDVATLAKDTAISAGVGLLGGSLVAPGPGTVIGGLTGAVGGFGYSLNGLGKPGERCVAEHIISVEHVTTHDAPLGVPSGQSVSKRGK